ncbi:hypothetical protein, partial [Moraxella catarrhalis]|uniref:hypothetical protein n=1 Tax=Moraxella catarrhalis TaxID=480 RepID=UPI001D0D945F
EHYDTHQMGKSCGSSAHDCVAKTRVWQVCLVYEAMIGGPQGEIHSSSSSVLYLYYGRTLRLQR